MRLLDLYEPWCIIPDRLREIRGIYETHLRGEKIDYKAIEAKLPGFSDGKSKGYFVQDGTAIIPIVGPIAKGSGGIFSFLFGSTSADAIMEAFEQALVDPSAYSIMLQIDSPGGMIYGVQELSTAIYEARGKKPIIAYTDGAMASGAYWIGSAADKAYISADTNMVGSIGVVTIHVDSSKANERFGEVVTEIYAGKYKRISGENAPLSDEGRQYLQDRVDYLYSVFVGEVARNRGVDTETVLSRMADGRVFVGKQAIEAGLVDGVSTMPKLLSAYKPSRMDMVRATVQARINQIQMEV